MSIPKLTRVDPHVHGGASACSRLSDEELLAWFAAYPHFAAVVTDHMAMTFYDRPELDKLRDRVIYGVELTVDGFDFLLLTPERGALPNLPPVSGSFRPLSSLPLETFADPRVLVIFAHPPLGSHGTGASLPAWFRDVPVDFLEYNAARLLNHPGIALRRDEHMVRETLRAVRDDLERLRNEFFPAARYVVGSDSHGAGTLGRTFLQLLEPCSGAAQVWRALERNDFVGRLSLFGRIYTVDPWEGLLGVDSRAERH